MGGWAAVFLTVPFLFHSFAIYPDGPAALCVIAGVWLLVRLESARDVQIASVWAVSIALSLLPWLHTRFAIVAAALGLGLLLRLGKGPDRRARIVALSTVPIVAAAAWFGFFWMIWGEANPSAPYGTKTGASLAYIGRGLTGLLADQQFGLLATAPVYVLAFAGARGLARKHQRLTTELAAACVPYVIATSAYAMWWGGFSAPARFLCALLPIAALLIASWWPRQSAAMRTLALLLLMLSVLLVLPRALVDQGRLLYSDRTGFDHVLNWSAQSVDLALALPSVHRDGTDGALRDAAVWLAAGLVLAAVAWMFGRNPQRSADATWATVAMAGAVCAMLAATVVWTRHGERAVTSNRSRIAALAAFRPDLHSTMVRLRPFRVMAEGEFLTQTDFGTTDRVVVRAGDPTLFRAASVPPGDYELLTSNGASPAGELTIGLGRNDPPIERWQLAGHQAGRTGLVLRLPVMVSSVTIRGDATAQATQPDLRLVASGLHHDGAVIARRATRAARYGPARVFTFDEQAYLEPTGFWTRAEGSASVVVDTDASADSPTMLIRAGAVATTIELSVGGWSRTLSLGAGQQENVTLPVRDGAKGWPLRIRSGAGFRPSAIDPASADVRHLAAWIELH